MKRRKIRKITAVTAGVLIGSAAFLPGCGQNSTVYGPPPEPLPTVTESPSVTRIPAPSVTPSPAATKAPTMTPTPEPSFAPETNVPEVVYGPPADEEYYEDGYYEDEYYDEGEYYGEDEYYDEGEYYGEDEYYDEGEYYGEDYDSEDYDPDENVLMGVYGPPEDL